MRKAFLPLSTADVVAFSLANISALKFIHFLHCGSQLARAFIAM